MSNLPSDTIYVRGLRHVKHTVFCVDEGQKTYYDPVSGHYVGYSSGQQVKRSVIERFMDALGEPRAEYTFRQEEQSSGAIESREVFTDCDPRHIDLLIGGWMRAVEDEDTIKRRSPLSVSALTPLHGDLANVTDEVLTLDRRDDPEDAHTIEVTDSEGNRVEDLDEFFEGKRPPTRHQFTDRSNNRRITGIFEYKVAVDLSRLFAVAKRKTDPELKDHLREDLREEGWPEDDDYFYLPREQREEAIPCLARALVEWQVTSNQQRTFSLQSNFATVVTRNASLAANAMYPYRQNGDVEPRVEDLDGTKVFLTNEAQQFIDGTGFSGRANQDAIDHLTQQLQSRSEELPQ
jgi:hypothetical protein